MGIVGFIGGLIGGYILYGRFGIVSSLFCSLGACGLIGELIFAFLAGIILGKLVPF